MAFMMVMTLWSLVLLMRPMVSKLLAGVFTFDMVGTLSLLLLLLALLFIREALKTAKSIFQTA